MVCYHPILAYRSQAGRDPETGKWPIVFNKKAGYEDMPVEIPCGQCIGCRLEKSRVWAMRCMHESTLYGKNSFVTLTYDDAHLPENGSLRPRDMTLFLKLLRKRLGDEKIRYFQAGEYGDLYLRPHHHILLFGYYPDDAKFYRNRNGYPYYSSDFLKDIWKNGNVLVGNLTFESAAYTARYCLKKVTGKEAEAHYSRVNKIPEYVTMSRRPGIGKEWFKKYYSDIYESIPGQSRVYIRGDKYGRPPRFYDDLYDRLGSQCHDNLLDIKAARAEFSKLNPDNTYSRLKVREKITLKKISELSRKFEEDM